MTSIQQQMGKRRTNGHSIVRCTMRARGLERQAAKRKQKEKILKKIFIKNLVRQRIQLEYLALVRDDRNGILGLSTQEHHIQLVMNAHKYYKTQIKTCSYLGFVRWLYTFRRHASCQRGSMMKGCRSAQGIGTSLRIYHFP
jgi:hypothetical protein